MNFTQIKEAAHALFEEASYTHHIKNNAEYTEALALMDELIEDYDYNHTLIEILSASIARWEDNADEFKEFNERINALDTGIAVLKELMKHHHLGIADFPEIGSKSLVSKILNGKRSLTLEHIKALSKRFGLNANLFINMPSLQPEFQEKEDDSRGSNQATL